MASEAREWERKVLGRRRGLEERERGGGEERKWEAGSRIGSRSGGRGILERTHVIFLVV